jgi:hypothetical protein
MTSDMKNTSWVLRIVGVLGWTGLCFATWAWWFYAMTSSPELNDGSEAANIAQGCGCLVATGTCGTVWFGGLVIAMVLYSLLRRG